MEIHYFLQNYIKQYHLNVHNQNQIDQMKRFGRIEKTTGIKHHFTWLRKVDKNMLHIRLYNMFDDIFVKKKN